MQVGDAHILLGNCLPVRERITVGEGGAYIRVAAGFNHHTRVHDPQVGVALLGPGAVLGVNNIPRGFHVYPAPIGDRD